MPEEWYNGGGGGGGAGRQASVFDPRDMGAYHPHPGNYPHHPNYHTGSLKRRSLAVSSMFREPPLPPDPYPPYAAPRANPAPYHHQQHPDLGSRDAKLLNQLGRMSPEEQLDKFLRSVAANTNNNAVREDTEFDDYAIVQKPSAKQQQQHQMPPASSGQGQSANSGWRSMDSLGQDPRRYSMVRRKVSDQCPLSFILCIAGAEIATFSTKRKLKETVITA